MAEKAFARESVEKGMRTAFLDALSDDGVVFDPGSGTQNGKEVWQAKKDSAAILDWQPILAVVATSGDLGYTTGPWNYRKSPNESRQPSANSLPFGDGKLEPGNCSATLALTTLRLRRQRQN